MSGDDEQVVAELLAGTGLRERDDDAWTAAVLEQVDALGAAERPSRWRRSLTVALPVLAAAALVLVLVRPQPPPEPGDGGEPVPLRAIEVYRTEATPGMRGDDFHPGDVVSIRAPVPDQGSWALWVYRDGRTLVLRCPGSEGCARDGATMTGRLRIPAIGTYQVLLVGGAGTLPMPTGSLDRDVTAVAEGGATVSLQHRFEAR